MRLKIIYFAAMVLLAVGTPATGAPSAKVKAKLAKEAQPGFDKNIQPLLDKYCYACHANGKHKGDLSLDGYKQVEAILGDQKGWEHILRNIRSREMPPENKPQPTPEERDQLASWIENTVFSSDCENPDPGRVTIRRLNRAEYNRTIQDLVHLKFKAAEDFPQDDVGYGFDNIGDVLSLPPVLLEKYLAAAERIMDAAIVTGGRKMGGPVDHISTKSMKLNGGVSKDQNATYAVMYSNGSLTTEIESQGAGQYKLRIKAFGQQAGPELPKMEVKLDDVLVTTFDVDALESNPKVYETTVKLSGRKPALSVAFINDFYDANAKNKSRRDRNLLVEYVELEGPLELQPYPESHTRIFTKAQIPADHSGYAREIIESFGSRAWRRPLAKDEITRLSALQKKSEADGDSFEESIKLTLEAILVSPHFLFRGEIQLEPDNPQSIHLVNEYALASRLSYFLWSSMPDDELFNLAGRKSLRKNLDAQIKRMLLDPRSSGLVENFAAQWLQFRNLLTFSPSKETFPEFDEPLRAAMRKETEIFFETIMREDRSVLEFIQADYSFVNERLAKHYGVEGIKGNEFQKVVFKDGRRGGLLTQASILTITSNPTRTSPVKRGRWILDNILGTPPPPPPPNVPELTEAKDKEVGGSLRQRMEQHRSNPACASCHARMDPIGFGLENFDGIGTWRDMDGKFPIEPGGKLVSGEEFQTPAQLRKVLSEGKRAEFLHCLTEKMMTYALGRGVEYYDKCALDSVMKALEKNQFKFATLVTEIIKSAPFQMRRGDSAALASADK